jgi:hypothetical protein
VERKVQANINKEKGDPEFAEEHKSGFLVVGEPQPIWACQRPDEKEGDNWANTSEPR